VIFRRDGERYVVFLGDDDRIGFVCRAGDGSWNHVDTTMAHSGYAKTRERAGQLLRRRYNEMAHLVVRHHNDQFSSLMNTCLPEWKLLRQMLNSAPLAHTDWVY